jgi:hypothetical protein
VLADGRDGRVPVDFLEPQAAGGVAVVAGTSNIGMSCALQRPDW